MNSVDRKVRIRDGANVGMDCHFFRWRDKGEVFDAKNISSDQWHCTAFGYGIHGQGAAGYGDGALFVRESDLIDIINDKVEAWNRRNNASQGDKAMSEQPKESLKSRLILLQNIRNLAIDWLKVINPNEPMSNLEDARKQTYQQCAKELLCLLDDAKTSESANPRKMQANLDEECRGTPHAEEHDEFLGCGYDPACKPVDPDRSNKEVDCDE